MKFFVEIVNDYRSESHVCFGVVDVLVLFKFVCVALCIKSSYSELKFVAFKNNLYNLRVGDSFDFFLENVCFSVLCC